MAYLAFCGRAPFSKEQYSFLADLLSANNESSGLHDYKTVRRQVMNNLTGWGFPKSDLYFVEDVARPRGTAAVKKVMTVNNGEQPALATVRMVTPSEWAKYDVCTYTFYADVFEHSERSSPELLSIEQAPIVRRRAPFVGESLEL